MATNIISKDEWQEIGCWWFEWWRVFSLQHYHVNKTNQSYWTSNNQVLLKKTQLLACQQIIAHPVRIKVRNCDSKRYSFPEKKRRKGKKRENWFFAWIISLVNNEIFLCRAFVDLWCLHLLKCKSSVCEFFWLLLVVVL